MVDMGLAITKYHKMPGLTTIKLGFILTQLCQANPAWNIADSLALRKRQPKARYSKCSKEWKALLLIHFLNPPQSGSIFGGSSFFKSGSPKISPVQEFMAHPSSIPSDPRPE